VTAGPGFASPPLLVLTDRGLCAAPLREVVATAVDCGARAVVLREKDLPPAERAELAECLTALLAPSGGVLIVAGAAPVAGGRSVAGGAAPGGARLHLAARDPFPTPRPALVGRSCHDAAEVVRAAAEGCDYVTVSPVYPTGSKPGYGPALGPAGLARLCRPGLPVFALGGVLPPAVPHCRRAGAYGVAVMGPVMRQPTIVAAYLAALAEMKVT
jgi:thiamine-phosphate pyrophosphorylase